MSSKPPKDAIIMTVIMIAIMKVIMIVIMIMIMIWSSTHRSRSGELYANKSRPRVALVTLHHRVVFLFFIFIFISSISNTNSCQIVSSSGSVRRRRPILLFDAWPNQVWCRY